MNNDPAKAAKVRAILATLLTIESVVVGSIGIWLIYLAVTAENFEILPLLGVLIFVALGSAGLYAAAAGFRRGKYFGRAPALLANLIAIGVSKYQFGAGLYIVAVPLLLISLVTAVMAIRAIPE
ncbi:MAG: hypothetical protein F2524_02700 [Actinobacteria bacterium]|nr:hypothetical protein [Actinomycetota bacterium]